MVRPTYETEADLSREENIARYAARKWNCAMRKQDKYNQFDYLIIKGKDVKAFVEIRTRTHTRGTYPTRNDYPKFNFLERNLWKRDRFE